MSFLFYLFLLLDNIQASVANKTRSILSHHIASIHNGGVRRVLSAAQ